MNKDDKIIVGTFIVAFIFIAIDFILIALGIW